MDTLRPDTVTVGRNRRSYRLHRPGRPTINSGSTIDRPPAGQRLIDDVAADRSDDAADDDDAAEIVQVDASGRHYVIDLTESIPVALYGRVVGRGGSTKDALEGEYGTIIDVGGGGRRRRHGVRVNSKTTSEADRHAVVATAARLRRVVAEARADWPMTHFVGVPMSRGGPGEHDATLADEFDAFKSGVVDCIGVSDDTSITDHHFQTSHLLHATLAPLVLLDDAEVAKAAAILESEMRRLSDWKMTPCVMAGLEIMNDDPTDCRVLYSDLADAATGERPHAPLQNVADALHAAYDAAGLLCRRGRSQKARQTVKLHVTVMNVKYAEAATGNKLAGIDVQSVLRQMSDYQISTTPFHPHSVVLSRRRKGQHGQGKGQTYDSVYETVAEVRLQQ